MLKISVIIPVYNALNDVKTCLNSILKNFNFTLGDVCVVNDASLADTTEYLNKFAEDHPNITLFHNEENLGFVKTCNRGMQSAQGDIIVLLNSDTKIPPEFCERIIKCFESDTQIGIASPISSHSGLYFIPLPKNTSLKKMNRLLRKKHKCCYPLLPNAEGFCFCIRKNVIENQGYLDTVWGKGYHEEVDYSYRAITNGWKNVLIDDLYVYHRRHASFGVQRRAEQIRLNDPLFKKRWDGFQAAYIHKNHLINPIPLIEKEIFPRGNPDERSLFSIKFSKDGHHKIFTVFGVKIKIKTR